MSYLAFARKYRPQTFLDVIGQKAVVRTLQNALSSDRLHHAYLFTGARGIGKTTVARILAKAMNCEAIANNEPCCKCQSCLDISAGISLAVREIDGASNTSIEDVRLIREQIKYMSPGGKYKVYIIDEVHMLSTGAFNALLKTLEEPPSHVIFMFATTEPQKIPATILSRCQRHDLRRLPPSLISDSLMGIAKNESLSIDKDSVNLIAGEAGGSLRDAQSLFDQAIAYCGTNVEIKSVEEMLGATDRTVVLEIVSSVAGKDAKNALKKLDLAYERGADLVRLSQDLLGMYRHLMIIAACKSKDAPVELPKSDIDKLSDIAKTRALGFWQQCFNLAYSGCNEVSRSMLPRASLEATIIRLSQVDDISSLVDIINELRSGEINVASIQSEKKPDNVAVQPNKQTLEEPKKEIKKEAPKVEVEAQTQTQTEQTDIQSIIKRWPEFCDWLKTKDPIISAIIGHGVLVEGFDKRIELLFVSPLHSAMIEEKERKEQFDKLLLEFFGTKVLYRVRQESGVNRSGDEGQKQSKSDDRIGEAVQNAKDILGAAVANVRNQK